MSRTAGAVLGAVLLVGVVLVVGSVVFGGGLPGVGDLSDGGGDDVTAEEDPTEGEPTGNQPGGSESPGRVTYSVSHEETVQRNYTSVVRQSFAFWETGDRNPNDLDFVYTTDRNGSDIHITFTGRIAECRGQRSGGTFAFCSVDTDGDQNRLLVAGVYRTGSMEALLRTAAGQYAGHDNPARFEGVPDLSTERLQFIDPWPTEETVTVNLSVRNGTDRDWEQLVGEGIDYWQENGSQYTTYSQEMVFDPDAAEADITVTVVEDIPECGIHDGTETRALGCAGRYNTSLLADETVSVRIEAGWNDRTTVQTVKHEFGHVYGLTHDDEPTSIMNATYAGARSAPETNVSERANPFGSDTVDVFVDTESFSAPASAVRSQIRHAVDYYRRRSGRPTPEHRRTRWK